MPALPGAHHICVACGDGASFQTRACSRPPEPMTKIFMNAPADYASGRNLESSERGCARSVSRSTFKLLRLVCDTAALRPALHSLKFCVQVSRLTLLQIKFHHLVSTTNFRVTIAADISHQGRNKSSVLPLDADFIAAARTQAGNFSRRPRLRQRGQQFN